MNTVKLLKIRTPENFAVIPLKFEKDGFNIRVMHPKDADGIANSVDPDQTAPLIWVCTVCPDLSVRKLRNITVPKYEHTLSARQDTSITLHLRKIISCEMYLSWTSNTVQINL